MEWNGMEWNGMEERMEWNGMEWNGMDNSRRMKKKNEEGMNTKAAPRDEWRFTHQQRNDCQTGERNAHSDRQQNRLQS